MAEPVRWGPDNPHPLFGRKTELVWDDKYDEYGARRPVDIAGLAMPMQKKETEGYDLWPHRAAHQPASIEARRGGDQEKRAGGNSGRNRRRET
mgnify:CR=1 FL=1